MRGSIPVPLPDVGAWALERIGAAEEPGAIESSPREKMVLLAALFVWTFGGYYAVGLTVDPASARTLHTPLDAAIPFSPVFMYGYEAVYTALLFPLFVVRCQRLFRRVALAYLAVATASTLVWIAFPVSAAALRGDVTTLDLSVFHQWGLRVNYAFDPPVNCFPSLHQAIAVLAALVAWKARPLFGALGLAGAAVVFVSICAVKQHYVLDGVAGTLLAVVVYLALVHGYDRAAGPPERVAYTWRGPALYAVVHASVLLALLVAFSLGLRPWELAGK